MKLLDSSAIIAFLNEDDSLHGKAMDLDLSESAFNELVLAEVANVLQKRVRNKQSVWKLLHGLVENTPLVLLTVQDVSDAVELFFAEYPRISYTDAVLIAQAKSLNAEIITFDENLKRAV